jgi:hypothetical protein
MKGKIITMAMFDVFKKKKKDDDINLEFEDDLDQPTVPEKPATPTTPPPPTTPLPPSTIPALPPISPPEPKAEERPGPKLPPLPKLPQIPKAKLPAKPEVIPKPPETAPIPKPLTIQVSPDDDKMIPLYEPTKDVPKIKPPSKPVMAVKPHVFVKVAQYKEVLGSIDRIKDMLTEMKQTIADIRRFETQEAAKLQICESITNQISTVVEFLDKTFTRPEM